MSVTLQDEIYFATCWWQIQPNTSSAPIAVGGGFQAAQPVFDSEGSFFAGVAAKTDASGKVTDVILAFGAATAPKDAHGADDTLAAQENSYNLPSQEADQAVALYRQVLNDPAYAGAVIHVAGHSLGAGLTQYVAAFSVATYGKAFTAAHADFTEFGTPPEAQGATAHFGLKVSDLDGIVTGYAAVNDVTPAAVPPAGALYGDGVDGQLPGVMHYLAAYQPYGDDPAFAAPNALSAHEALTFTGAFGLPSWLTAAQQQQVISEVVAAEPAGDKYDPTYGAGGGVSQGIVGDGAANVLTGTASNDVLRGAGGADVLVGGGGRDVFQYVAAGDSAPRAHDLITDFQAGDLLDLSALSPLVPLSFAGEGLGVRTSGGVSLGAAGVGGAISLQAGQVAAYVQNGDTFVAVDLSGGAQPDLLIELAGVHHLTASDFALGGPASLPGWAVAQIAAVTGDPYVTHVVAG